MHLRSADFSSAFTNGDLNEVIYMRQPQGFHQGSPNMVCLLKKSLYGLKQGARQWNKKLHETFLELGFTRLISDRSVYLYSQGGVPIIVPVYIDDITIASKSKEALDRTVEDLSKRFKLHNLGETKFILGVEIIRDHPNCTISLSRWRPSPAKASSISHTRPLGWWVKFSPLMGSSSQFGPRYSRVVPLKTATESSYSLTRLAWPSEQ
jgi:hypothetical protein